MLFFGLDILFGSFVYFASKSCSESVVVIRAALPNARLQMRNIRTNFSNMFVVGRSGCWMNMCRRRVGEWGLF